MSDRIRAIHDHLLDVYGPQHWWPGDGRDEIIIGAVLTQNTAWRNVVRAIDGLKEAGMCDLPSLALSTPEEIAPLIRPSGYYNLKARRLHAVASWFAPNGRARFGAIAKMPTETLRAELLRVPGVGRETADSILLYALERPSFVSDTYTLRIFSRHGFAEEGTDYETLRGIVSAPLPVEVRLYNEFHALLVKIGHNFCKPTPRCAACPLRGREHFATAKAWRALKDYRASA